MKRKRNPKRTDRENPVWTTETFSRSRKAREVLLEIFDKQAAAKMHKPRGRPKTGNARTSISRVCRRIPWLALESYRARLANPFGRGAEKGSLRGLPLSH
jgi:uncharacterized protein (DUF4415 family)